MSSRSCCTRAVFRRGNHDQAEEATGVNVIREEGSGVALALQQSLVNSRYFGLLPALEMKVLSAYVRPPHRSLLRNYSQNRWRTYCRRDPVRGRRSNSNKWSS